MCGFAGFTGYLADGDAVLERMMNKIIHRGPDSAGKYIDDKAYMGFRRLSIIDLDNGSQPMFNENKNIFWGWCSSPSDSGSAAAPGAICS